MLKILKAERRDTNLTHAKYRLPRCVESPEKLKLKAGYFSQHCGFQRLQKETEVMLVGAARWTVWRKEVEVEKQSDINGLLYRYSVWIEVKVGKPFQLAGGHGGGWRQGVCV